MEKTYNDEELSKLSDNFTMSEPCSIGLAKCNQCSNKVIAYSDGSTDLCAKCHKTLTIPWM